MLTRCIDVERAVLEEERGGELKHPQFAEWYASQWYASQDAHDVRGPASPPAASLRTDPSGECVRGVLAAALFSRVRIRKLREVVAQLTAHLIDGEA